MPAFKPIDAGTEFGRLTTLEARQSGQKIISCRCACGTVKEVSAYRLLGGHTRSCGCLQRDVTTQRNTTHGMTGSRARVAWNNMHQRCTNPNRPQWKDWGGRGISVCDRWQDFESFYEDMGDPPDGLLLDRIDNDAGYSPENCRWTTRVEQNRNRRPSTTPAEGFSKPAARLSPAQVADIRQQYAAGGVTQRDLATRYGVGQSQISRITRGQRWAETDTPTQRPLSAGSER